MLSPLGQAMSKRSERVALWLCWLAGVFIFLRPSVAFRPYNALDDACYLQWAARTVGETWPSCTSSSYPPGIALLWLPAALLTAEPFSALAA